MYKKIKLIFVMAAIAFTSVIAYTFLHESGHALVAIFCGAQITKLSILEAHTWWEGGNFTAATLSLCHAAGSLLPVFVSLIALFFYKKEFKYSIYHLAYSYYILCSTISLSVWVIMPILSMFTSLPDSDDVTKFLQTSKWPPIAVSFAGAALILLVLFIAKRNGMFQSLVCATRSLINTKDNSPDLSKKEILGVSFALLTAILLTILLELPDIMTKPIISLTATDERDITDFQKSFEVVRDGNYRFQIQLDSQGILTDLRISDKEQNLHYQMLTEKASASNTIYLNAGTYTISVTYLKDIETFDRYCKEMNYVFDETAQKEMESIYEQDMKTPKLSLTIK